MRLSKVLVLAGLAVAAVPSMAQVTFNDATGDVSSTMIGYGNPNIDLVSLEISNTLTSISFKFTTNSPDITSPNWVKLNAIFRLVGDGGASVDTSANGNGWGRPYNLDGGANRFIGGWVDSSGGFETRTFTGGSWNLTGATYNSTAGMSLLISGNSVTYTAALGLLGLNVGDTIRFDAITTGGGSDGAWDAVSLATQTIAGPGDPFTLNSQLNYTVVPEPGTMAALGLGALALMRRRKKA